MKSTIASWPLPSLDHVVVCAVTSITVFCCSPFQFRSIINQPPILEEVELKFACDCGHQGLLLKVQFGRIIMVAQQMLLHGTLSQQMSAHSCFQMKDKLCVILDKFEAGQRGAR
jgi:hypothetical protein